ncbi:MAG: membrane fusion protein (multidrug efflux system) [Psychromonas sp.]|jgi:membrane fusion protein (multidrug efflux system)|uniref:HlyD family secretion protein n=1 Tax=Psychromonas sp. TaxID=1884585 RepID=UPI0039E6C4AD
MSSNELADDVAEDNSKPKHRKKRFVLLTVIPALIAVGIVGVYLSGGRFVDTDNAYVKADKVPVSSQVDGMIEEVLVKENQQVEVGQVLFRIDSATFEVAVAKAQANISQVRTDLAALKSSYFEKLSEIELERTRLEFANKQQVRQQGLIAKNFVSSSQFDQSKETADIVKQQIKVLQQDLHRIAETLGGRVDSPTEQHPSYLAAVAILNQAKLDLERVNVRASLPGVVSHIPQPGQFANVGNTAMALIANRNMWVEANFTETDITHLKKGQNVTIQIDTYPDLKWTGKVESISPATGSEFSVIPAQNATGNWVKITQRVSVRISLDNIEGLPQLLAGLSAIVEIDTGHHRQLFGMTI